MKVTILIPARMTATRFPGKPLAPILGKPMIQWVYEQSKRSVAHRVIVATDSAEIFDAVQDFGGEVIMTREVHDNGTSRIAEIAAQIDTGLVVNVQGDEPAIAPETINQAIYPLVSDPSLEMSTLACPVSRHQDLFNPNVVKVVTNLRDEAMYFSRSPIPFLKHEGMKKIHWKKTDRVRHLQHIGVYGYRRDFLLSYVQTPPCALEQVEGLEQLRALYMGARIKVARVPEASVGVDTPEDVARVEAYMEKHRR